MIDVAHSMASANPSSSSSSAAAPATPQGLKNYFKTPEGRHELHHEKDHPPRLMNPFQGKTVTQATLAHLKDRLSPSTPPAQPSSFSIASGVRSAAARLLGGSNGGRTLSFVGGNYGSKSVSVTTRLGSLGGVTGFGSSTSTFNFDGKGTYLIFHIGDTLFISDLNTWDKDPMKAIHFNNMYPVCHAYDHDAKDGMICLLVWVPVMFIPHL